MAAGAGPLLGYLQNRCVSLCRAAGRRRNADRSTSSSLALPQINVAWSVSAVDRGCRDDRRTRDGNARPPRDPYGLTEPRSGRHMSGPGALKNDLGLPCNIVGQAKLYGVNFDSVTGLDTEDFAAGKEGDEELAAAQKALQQKKDDAERARPRAPPQGLWSAFVGGLMSVGLPPPKPHSVTNKLVETDEIRRNKSLIQNAVKKSNLTYEQTLVLADEDAVLAAARESSSTIAIDVGCVTCRLNAPNRRRGRVTTDLAAQGMGTSFLPLGRERWARAQLSSSLSQTASRA
eukprot:scaffold878_cov271-Pinguiococcus_pyrenoidosus.AAC.50